MAEEERRGGFSGIAIRGASLSGGGWIFGQVLNLAIYLVLARLATPEEFGQVVAGSILVGMASLFADSGMTAALIQRRDRVEEAANTALFATLAAGLGLSLVALAAAPLIGAFFDDPEVAWVAAAASGWIFLRAATAVPDAVMQRRFSFLRRLVVEPLGIVVFGAVSIVALAAGMGVWGLVLGNTAQRLSMVAASWGLARWRPQPRLASFALWREMVGYGRHVIGGEVIKRIAGQVQVALIGRFVGTSPLGQYYYAQRIAQHPHGLVVNAGAYVLFPTFSRIADDPARLRAGFLRSLRWICLLGMPIGFIMLPLGVAFAVLLFGEQWRLAGEAAMALCAYTGFQSVVAISSEAAKAIGRPQMLVRIYAVGGALTVALVAAAVPLGLVAVAAAVSLGSVGAAGYAIATVGPRLSISFGEMARQIWPALSAAVVMALAISGLEHGLLEAESRGTFEGLLILSGEVAAAAVVYVLALRIISPATAGELRDMARAGRRKLGRRAGTPAAEAGP